MRCGSCGLTYVGSATPRGSAWYRCNGRSGRRGPLGVLCPGRVGCCRILGSRAVTFRGNRPRRQGFQSTVRPDRKRALASPTAHQFHRGRCPCRQRLQDSGYSQDPASKASRISIGMSIVAPKAHSLLRSRRISACVPEVTTTSAAGVESIRRVGHSCLAPTSSAAGPRSRCWAPPAGRQNGAVRYRQPEGLPPPGPA